MEQFEKIKIKIKQQKKKLRLMFEEHVEKYTKYANGNIDDVGKMMDQALNTHMIYLKNMNMDSNSYKNFLRLNSFSSEISEINSPRNHDEGFGTNFNESK
ncbi:hypothetical protein PVAND_013035 [Polypedilum vanderplanki]|uniref:Uncharacterized protein n=1 Tax=Polypedilum vanderplanki TaxID=319348 RepID=A0A9J6CQ84_POLVA|nr:hypothetical protein PVAND_013035 [Polypedilum vanderplanki]